MASCSAAHDAPKSTKGKGSDAHEAKRSDAHEAKEESNRCTFRFHDQKVGRASTNDLIIHLQQFSSRPKQDLNLRQIG